jgi:zinc transport system substrate-binding protein
MRTVLTLGLAVGFALPGCSDATAEGDPGASLSVVASFYPLAFVAQRVGGRCVEVTDLTPTGVEPHDLELNPDDVASIATADVVLSLGGGFQPAVDDVLDEAEGIAVDVLQGVSTLANSEQGEDAPAVDPHVWLDPGRFAAVVDQVEDALLRSGLSSSCDVADRADQLRDELGALDRRFRNGLADCRLDTFVTSHAAFGYLADAYGLRQVAIAGLEPGTEPDPRRLADIAEVVRAEHVDTIFTEELVSPELAETLARETGAGTAVLATIEGLTEPEAQAGADYLSLMEEDLDALRGALDCA